MRHPLNTPIGRFGIDTLADGPTHCLATMPVAGLVNPITGAPSLGPLAVLVDHVGGLVNHYRRGDREWTVSSELALELSPTCGAVIADHPGVPVRATGRPVGAKTATALADCDLTVGDDIVGTGTVRSFYVEAPGEFAPSPDRADDMEQKIGLAAMMASGEPRRDGESHVLPQRSDRVLNNSTDVVHGGIASTGLETVASAALNAGRDDPLVTASLLVNFLRPVLAGSESRYVGTALRIGRRSGVAEAQAIGADGRVALIARLTAYGR